MNNGEYRIILLYEYLQRGIKPWEWDFENYTGSPEKDEMRGMFYAQDWNNILQIEVLKAEKRKRESQFKDQRSGPTRTAPTRGRYYIAP